MGSRNPCGKQESLWKKGTFAGSRAYPLSARRPPGPALPPLRRRGARQPRRCCREGPSRPGDVTAQGRGGGGHSRYLFRATGREEEVACGAAAEGRAEGLAATPTPPLLLLLPLAAAPAPAALQDVHRDRVLRVSMPVARGGGEGPCGPCGRGSGEGAVWRPRA